MSLLAMISPLRWFARSPNDVAAQIAELEQQASNEPRRAMKHHQRATQLASRHNMPRSEAHNLYQLGLLLSATGTTRRAEAALSRAADISETLGEHLAAGDAHLARAGVCLMDRRVSAAQTFADKASESFDRVDALPDRPQLTRLLSAIKAMRIAANG